MMLYDLYWYLSNLPRWHIFAVFLVGYFVYYLIEVVKVSLMAASYFLFYFNHFFFFVSKYDNISFSLSVYNK